MENVVLFKRRTSGLAALMLALTAAPIAHSADWSPWSDLFNFKPEAQKLIEARTKRLPAGSKDKEKTYEVQRIADGAGERVNFDEYSITIDQMPKGMDNAAVFKYFRENVGSLLDTNVAAFKAYTGADEADWKKSPDLLGTIMIFEIKLPGGVNDKGAVVVSKSSPFTWTFSPIKSGLEVAGDFGTHPVAGNREFGLRIVTGKAQIYTRAADRVYPIEVAKLAEGKAFSGADALWKSMQENVAAYIIGKGGKATTNMPIAVGGLDNKPTYKEVCKTNGFDCPK